MFSIAQAQILPPPPKPEAGTPVAAPTVQNTFRTPARMYGTAYSVKVKVVRGEFEWVVPVWIKPDVAKSGFDMALMRLMGWNENKFNFDEVSISGIPLDQKNFTQVKADWAYFPDFAKSCCVGILGRDILENYEIRFDPRSPSHLEWKPAEDATKTAKKSKIPEADLQGLFMLRGTTYKKHNLTEVPYTLNLRESELVFEPVPAPPAKKGRTSSLFEFDILPQARKVQVLGISPDVRPSASKVGLKAGEVVTELDGTAIGKLDRQELEQILRGKKQDRITLTLDTQKEISFDFKKNQFAPAQPVPSRTR